MNKRIDLFFQTQEFSPETDFVTYNCYIENNAGRTRDRDSEPLNLKPWRKLFMLLMPHNPMPVNLPLVGNSPGASMSTTTI